MTDPRDLSNVSSDDLRRVIQDYANTVEAEVGTDNRDIDAINDAAQAFDKASDELGRRGE